MFEEDKIETVVKNFAKAHSLSKVQQSKLFDLINNEIQKIKNQVTYLNDIKE